MKAVVTSAAQHRCASCAGVRAPLAMKAATRVASPLLLTPAASMKAPSSSHTVSSPSERNKSRSRTTPISTSAMAAPSATQVSSTDENIHNQMAMANTHSVSAPPAGSTAAPGAGVPMAADTTQAMKPSSASAARPARSQWAARARVMVAAVARGEAGVRALAPSGAVAWYTRPGWPARAGAGNVEAANVFMRSTPCLRIRGMRRLRPVPAA